MGVGIPREIGDARVAAAPKTIAQLRKLGYHVFVESGTGLGTSFGNDAYREVGGVIVDDAWDRNIVLTVGAPSDTQLLDMHPGATLISFLASRQDPSLTRGITAQGANALSMNMVPRTFRAQALDTLSSLAGISGYRAVVEAVHAFGRSFTGQVTTAGKVPPAIVFVIGTDVTGLATTSAASSPDAVVRAADVRPETAERVTSIGATFLRVGQADQGVSSDGYAKEVGADYAARAAELYAAQMRKVDIIITTTTIPGKPSPKLITTEMVESMKPGSVIVDMAAIGGGNCELTRPGEGYVTENRVTVVGYTNLSSRLPGQSSQLYGAGLVNTLKFTTPGKNRNLVIDFDDEVVRNMTIIHDEEVTFPPPEIRVSTAPAPATTTRPSTPTILTKPPRPWWHQVAWVRTGSVALITLLTLAPSPLVDLMVVFVLAVIVDYYMVQNVTHVLHTPSMSVANIVNGIIMVSTTTQLPSDNWVVEIITFVAILTISINVFSGFTVTHRMLDMFRKGQTVLTNLVNAAYIAAGLMSILALAGLSRHETTEKGDTLGILGMALVLMATNCIIAQSVDRGGFDWTSATLLYGTIAIGAIIGTWKVRGVEMTGTPELIALLHSFVGAATVLVGFNVRLSATHTGALHAVEVVLGIFIGAVTLTGSLVAWGKLNGHIASKPLTLPDRNWLNLATLVAVTGFGCWYVATLSLIPLLLVTLISLALGCHPVTTISGADMPVVILMPNFYSGQAAAFSGFMLDQTILIITDALVGASGAVLSYIMCRAMDRSFVSVILGGFGDAPVADSGETGERQEVTASDVARVLTGAHFVVAAPRYGMAVAQTRYPVAELTARLRERGINVKFVIHPVVDRLLGHMNVLLAEAKVPYDTVLEMDEINDNFTDTDVVLVIGANDAVNPAANEPGFPISGIPVLEMWETAQVVIFRRSMNAGYADVQNPLFFNENSTVCLGGAKATVQSILDDLRFTTG